MDETSAIAELAEVLEQVQALLTPKVYRHARKMAIWEQDSAAASIADHAARRLLAAVEQVTERAWREGTALAREAAELEALTD